MNHHAVFGFINFISVLLSLHTGFFFERKLFFYIVCDVPEVVLTLPIPVQHTWVIYFWVLIVRQTSLAYPTPFWALSER
jgi:hypothetical protein